MPTAFPQFSALPLELQCLVWKFVIPDPFTVPSIIVIPNFDAKYPKAIISHPRDVITAYSIAYALRYPINYGYSHEEFRLWDPWLGREELSAIDDIRSIAHARGTDRGGDKSTVLAAMRDVIALMQQNRATRYEVLKVFTLNMAAKLPHEPLPWDPEDSLYFPLISGTSLGIGVFFLGGFQRISPHIASCIRHIAVDGTSVLVNSLQKDPTSRSIERATSMLETLPNLQSVYLLFDPGRHGLRRTGSLVLYEPQQVPLNDMGEKTPALIAHDVEQSFGLAAMELDAIEFNAVELDIMELDAMRAQINTPYPEVECAVICWKKPKGML